MTKTNAMRRLDAAKIPYEVKEYVVDENDLSGVHIASQIGLPFEQVFKTLTARGDKTGVLVFCLPVDREIDLKKVAAITGNKKIELLPVKELLSVIQEKCPDATLTLELMDAAPSVKWLLEQEMI